MHRKRWRALAMATVLLMATALLPAQAAAAGGNGTSTGTKSGTGTVSGKPKPTLPERALTVTGLADNQSVSGEISFDVQGGGTARTLYIYSQLSPWNNYTSYSWGEYDARSGQVHVSFDTAFLPDGMHMVTLYTRDASNRMLAVGALSIFVQNWYAQTDLASHFDISQPLAFSKQQGNAIAVKLSDLKTGKIAAYEYHLSALSFPYLRDSIKVITTGPVISQQIPIKGLAPGFYALTVYGLDQYNRIIDKATVTLDLAPGK